MDNFDENFVKKIKLFISESPKSKEIKDSQKNQFEEKSKQISEKPIESFKETPLALHIYIDKCKEITNIIPIIVIKDEFNSMIQKKTYEEDKYLMNIGSRLSLNYAKKVIFEEWRNVINAKDRKVVFSLHKVYTENSKLEVQISYDLCFYLLEIYLSDSDTINNCKYTIQNGPISTSYISNCFENNNELVTILTYDNSDEKCSETRNEKITYSEADSNAKLKFDESRIKRVDKEATKKEEKFDYNEKSSETYYIDHESGKL